MLEYTYLGDKLTRPELRGAQCDAIRRADGKCIRGKLGTMLVRLENGEPCNVIGRMLRRNDKLIG